MRLVLAWRYAATALTTGLGVVAHAQPCSPFWANPAPFGPLHYYLATPFNDGSGPALYAVASALRGQLPAGAQNALARWNGHEWTLLLQGLPPLVAAGNLLVLDDGAGPRLYAGGITQDPPGPYVSHMWVWSGTQWEAPPPGMYLNDPDHTPSNAVAGPFCSFDDGTGMAIYGLYADSTTPGWEPSRWDGQRWVSLGADVGPGSVSISRVEAFDLGDGPTLYVAGHFAGLIGMPAQGIVRWDRIHGWRPLGSGFDASGINDLEVFDAGQGRELYVTGDFVEAGGVPDTASIARWNGQQWSAVPGANAGMWRNLAVFDDGTGLGLYVTGDFIGAGGTPARNIARFDGEHWSALGAGVPSPSRGMAVFNDGRGPSLWVSTSGGGGATTGGGIIGGGLAQWVGCPNCYANCDNSTRAPTLNVLDFLCFLNKFAARDPYANCNVDATIDVSDFLCFLNRFAAGCS